MLCYKDQTFCSSDCINTACYRYLSPTDEIRAKELKLPVAWNDLSDDCPGYAPEVENGES